jgi:hypothetical protein
VNSAQTSLPVTLTQPKTWRKPFFDSLLLTLATIAFLTPFSGKAFNIDDPLFVWTAQQLTQHPLNPYGFHLVWYRTDQPMFAITKNPPLASYFGAMVGVLAGWSERAWHIAFFLPAIGVVLGSYRLAQRFSSSPLVAAAATLVAPGFLVSATTVMCDVSMLALWMWAVIFWLEAIDSDNPLQFVVSGLLIAACSLAKYFGGCLIPLLAVYSLAKRRRLGSWLFYLLLPIAALIAYQLWTKSLYGRGLLWDAAEYTRSPVHAEQGSHLTNGLVGLSFTGGCALPMLLFAPLLWARHRLLVSVAALCGVLAAAALGCGRLHPLFHDPSRTGKWTTVEFGLFVAGGILTLGLAIADFEKSRREPAHALDALPDSLFLALWIFGTFIFAAFLNWTINARSILPLVPAAAILLVRRSNPESGNGSSRLASVKFAIPLALAAIISLVVSWGDLAFANSARTMAQIIRQRSQQTAAGLLFQGHWGFQYYMQSLGAQPLIMSGSFAPGALLVTPENTTNTLPIAPQFVGAEQILQIEPRAYASTMALGGGFYSSAWGPLPFSFGKAPRERYLLQSLQPTAVSSGR